MFPFFICTFILRGSEVPKMAVVDVERVLGLSQSAFLSVGR